MHVGVEVEVDVKDVCVGSKVEVPMVRGAAVELSHEALAGDDDRAAVEEAEMVGGGGGRRFK